MLVFSDALRTSRAQLLAAAIDEGSAGAATLTIYTGPRPAPGAAITDLRWNACWSLECAVSA